MMKWYDKTAQEVATLTETPLSSGLSDREAAKRIRAEGKNELSPSENDDLPQYIRQVALNMMFILLAVSAAVAFALGRATEGAVLLALCALNIVTVAVTYVKARKVLENVAQMSHSSAKVLRGGRILTVGSDNVARGDIIILSYGDIVPCDARLISCEDFFVRETGITAGNVVKKNAAYLSADEPMPHRRLNMVYANTVVEKGRAFAIVCERGKNTLFAGLVTTPKTQTLDRTRIIVTLRRFSGNISLILLAVVFLLAAYCLMPFSDTDIFGGWLIAVTFGASAMSELYTVFGYIIISCGVFGTLEQKKKVNCGALIKNIRKLDRIASVTVFGITPDLLGCTDAMKLCGVFRAGKLAETDGKKFTGSGSPKLSGDDARLLLGAYISTGLYSRDGKKNGRNKENVCSEADEIAQAALSAGITAESVSAVYRTLTHTDASGASGFETTVVYTQGRVMSFVRGEVDEVLRLCSSMNADGIVKELDAVAAQDMLTNCNQRMRRGFRVVAVAYRELDRTSLADIDECRRDMTLDGFLVFSQPFPHDIAKTADSISGAGKRVVVFSEKRAQAFQYMKALGIASDEKEIADGTLIDSLSDAMLRTNIDIYRLFVGMSNTQKLRVIRCYAASGETVAYMGSKLRDVAVFRGAAVGMCCGTTYSENMKIFGIEVDGNAKKDFNSRTAGECQALRYAADVIITPSAINANNTDKTDNANNADIANNANGGLRAVCATVARAKTIYFNISGMLAYLLTVNSARAAAVLWTVFSGTMLITPVQIAVSGLAVDLAAVLTIAFNMPGKKTLSDPCDTHAVITGASSRAVSALLGLFIGGTAVALSYLLGISDACGTVFLSVLASSIALLISCARPRTLISGGIVVSNALLASVALIFALIALSAFFAPFSSLIGVTGISTRSWLVIALSAVLTVASDIVRKALRSAMMKKNGKIR